jgi:hypothetical protein
MHKPKISHIVPIELKYATEKYSDMHLLLLHWALKSKEYIDFFAASTKYKILDNSFYELKKPLATNTLLEYAEKLAVQEVVAPDYMYNKDKTIKSTKEFISKNKGKFNVQAVVCGKDLQELIDCFIEFNHMEGVDIIAISKHGFKNGQMTFFEARQFLLQKIAHKSRKPIHLLGANSIAEMFISYPDTVRSIDSKYFAKIAHNGSIDLNTKCGIKTKSRFEWICKSLLKFERQKNIY